MGHRTFRTHFDEDLLERLDARAADLRLTRRAALEYATEAWLTGPAPGLEHAAKTAPTLAKGKTGIEYGRELKGAK